MHGWQFGPRRFDPGAPISVLVPVQASKQAYKPNKQVPRLQQPNSNQSINLINSFLGRFSILVVAASAKMIPTSKTRPTQRKKKKKLSSTLARIKPPPFAKYYKRRKSVLLKICFHFLITSILTYIYFFFQPISSNRKFRFKSLNSNTIEVIHICLSQKEGHVSCLRQDKRLMKPQLLLLNHSAYFMFSSL